MTKHPQTLDEIKAIYIAWRMGAQIQARFTPAAGDLYFKSLTDDGNEWDNSTQYSEALDDDNLEGFYIWQVVEGGLELDSCTSEFRIKPTESSHE